LEALPLRTSYACPEDSCTFVSEDQPARTAALIAEFARAGQTP
jgi:hypothetical protein